jgi:hypothetical protein
VVSPEIDGEPQKLTGLYLRNVETWGGKHPLIRLTYPGQNAAPNHYVVEDCASLYFKGSVVSSLAVDHPYWKIKLQVVNIVEAGIAVALAGYTDACDIDVDATGTIGFVKVGRGGNSARVRGTYIPITYSGNRRWGVWHVPEPAATVSGAGFEGREIRFPNESYNNDDWRILIADADTTTGADFASQMPLETASAGYCSAIHYTACKVAGSGADNGPFVYSTTPNLEGATFESIIVNGTPPGMGIQFLTPPAANANSMTNSLLDWRTDGITGINQPGIIPSNDPGVLVRDPNQIFSATVQAYPGGASRVDRVRLLAGNARSLAAIGAASVINIVDGMSPPDAIKVNLTAFNDGAQALLSAPIVGRPIYVDVALRQDASDPASQILVELTYNSGVPHYERWLQALPASWQNFRFFHPGLREASSNLFVRFVLDPNGIMPAGNLNIADLHVVHASEPQISRLGITSPVPAVYPVSTSYFQGHYNVGTAIPGIGSLRLGPVLLAEDCTLEALFAEFTAAGSSDSTFIPCILSDNGSFRPGDLIVVGPPISTGTANAGSVATGGTPGVYATTISEALRAGLYWIGGVQEGTTGATMRTGTWGPGSFGYGVFPAADEIVCGYAQASVSSLTLPFTFTNVLLGGANAIPRVGFQVQ